MIFFPISNSDDFLILDLLKVGKRRIVDGRVSFPDRQTDALDQNFRLKNCLKHQCLTTWE